MQKNPHHDLLGNARVRDVYRSWGLTFADDKIVDEMITRAWFYSGPPLRMREKAREALKNNPRCTLIEGAFKEMKEEFEAALARALEKKENKK
ncbi:MAG: hypothetical protein AAB630_01605 [Patescibacteria group bacterium]